jgi:hypothetical protein
MPEFISIPEEAIEAAALAQRSPSHRPGPPDPDLVEIWKRTARLVLGAAAPLIVAANRTALPGPMPRDDDRDPIAWHPEGIDGQVSAHPDEGEVDFEYWSWSPTAARALALSLLAAAEYVEARASVLRGEGQTDG